MYQTEARRHGQNITTTTDDTTFAGGLRHITSVLPSLMNDIIQHAPDNQKVINFKHHLLWRGNTNLEEMQSLFQENPFQIDYWTFLLLTFLFVHFFSGQAKLSGLFVGENKEIVRHLDTIEDIPRRHNRGVSTKIRNRVNHAHRNTTFAAPACQNWYRSAEKPLTLI